MRRTPPNADAPARAPSRRELVGGAAVLGCALQAPLAWAEPGGILAQVAALRALWQDEERALLRALAPDGRWPEAPEARAALLTLCRGLSAFQAAEALRGVPVRDQVHREIQGLIHALALAVSAAERAAQEVVALLDEVEDEAILRGGLRALRRGLGDWALSPPRRAQLEALLDGLSDDPRASLRRLRRRGEKARRLTAQVAQDPRGLDLLTPASPSVQAEVAEGQRAWGGEAATPLRYRRFGEPASRTRLLWELAELTLGLTLLGLVFCGGYAIAVAGVCLLFASGPVGLLLILLGLTGMAIGAWGLVRVTKVTLRRYDAPPPRLLRGFAPEVSLDVHGQQAWVPSGLRREAGQPVYAEARGRLHGPWGLSPHPGGDGLPAGTDALWPGAPEAALIARVGSARYALGPEATLPPGPAGEVELAINLSPAQAELCRGFIWVRLRTG
ncbi:MAG: hypothetical protein H6741_16145 [Alphaproteobacteria bacterium]|nr:hypothetical protein [Alphaproteobacteria bacterium]MCB9794245.1 hypothetical protein [Alphaproteobacteria bacterium]